MIITAVPKQNTVRLSHMKKWTLALLLIFAGFVGSGHLTAQQQSNQESAHQKNYYNCLHGYFGCDPTQLTSTEQPLVQQAAHQRNYDKCLHGYIGCDPIQLTSAEQPLVQQAAHQRNYDKCLHGYAGCDSSQLSDSEKESVSAAKPPAAPNQGTTPPRTYTNSDGQRVQSPTQSSTVPAGATAQCRDGSYSFSQHRQGTCSHHGGVSRWLD
jgi:hypothetical protein